MRHRSLLWWIGIGILLFLVFGALTLRAAPGQFPSYLPDVQSNRVEPQPPAHIRPPDGVRCFGLDIHVAWDSTGSYFAQCQAQDGRGQVLWVQRPDGSRVLLRQYGSSYGNKGNLFVAQDGWAYVAVSNGDGSDTLVEVVPGWTP